MQAMDRQYLETPFEPVSEVPAHNDIRSMGECEDSIVLIISYLPQNQIQTWKKALADGAAAIFDQGNGSNKGKEQKNKNNDALVARLYQRSASSRWSGISWIRSMTPAQRRELTFH